MTPLALNPNLRGLPHSPTLAINERSKAMQRSGRRIFRFGLGQSPFPVPDPVVATLRQYAAEKDYLPVAGLARLREAVAAYHRRVDGLEFANDGILIGPGSKELMFLLQVAHEGDLVVPTPCWVSYGPQARILGRRVVTLPGTFEERYRLRPSRLRDACAADPGRSRVLILNYPGNPDGTTYSDDELAELAAIARQYNVIVLSDEIYGPLYFDGRHTSIARHYPEGTIVSGGISKWCGAGGWRLGTFAFPPALAWLRDAIAAAASETYTSVNAPVQYAAVTAFEGSPEIDAYLDRCRDIVRGLGAWCANALRETGVRLHDPTGGFYLFADFEPMRERLAERGIRDSRTLCERLLEETGVAVLPSAAFERPAAWGWGRTHRR